MVNVPWPPLLQKAFGRAYAWYEGSLINRMTLKGQLIIGSITLGIGVVCLMLVYALLAESVTERLNGVASLNQQRLEWAMDRLLTGSEFLAGRSATLDALAKGGSGGGQEAVFLQEFRQEFPEILTVYLLDRSGQGRASAGAPRALPEGLISRVLAEGRAGAGIGVGDEQATLLVAVPVRDKLAGRMTGILLVVADLRQLAGRAILPAQTLERLPVAVVLSAGGGGSFFREGAKQPGATIAASFPVGGRSRDLAIPLTVTVSIPRHQAYAPLYTLGLMLGFIILCIPVVTLVMARRLAVTVVGPLDDMSRRAMEIASAGPLGLRELEIRRQDEVARMGMAFNEMVASLRTVYANQEAQVQLRTRELAEARERLAGILAGMDDLVYVAAADFSRIEYMSPAVMAVLGHAADEFYAMPRLFSRVVAPDDVELVALARDDLPVSQAIELRYRVVRPDGRVRWVLDRSHVQRDAQGQALRVHGILRDITAVVEAEALLALRERALASTSCGVVIADMSQAGAPVIYVNEAFHRITGYREEEVLGANCRFLQGPQGDPAVQEEIRQIVREGRDGRVLIRNYRKSGEAFWNELSLSPLRDATGRVTHYIGIQNDMTDSVNASQALVASERRLALTIDALEEGVWDWNIDQGSLYTSPSWAKVLGLEPTAVPADPSAMLAQVPIHWTARLMNALEAHLAGEGAEFRLEHEMVRADGSLIWVVNRGRIVERAPDGRPLRMLGTISNITEQYQTSAQIIDLMRRLDAIFTLSPDAFAYFDADGGLSYVNQAFEDMTGIPGGEVNGLTPQELLERLRTLADPEQPFPELPAEGGEACVRIFLASPVVRVLQLSRRGSPTSGFAVLYWRDVTKESEVERMKSEFLSTAAHELRTPMASIMGFAELLMLRPFDRETAADCLGTIHRQANRLTDLINELLDLARIEARAGKDFKLERQPVQPLILEAVSALNVEGERGCMEVCLDDGLPELEVDGAKLQQALLNVLSNAYKYSPGGGPIRISTVVEPAEAGGAVGIRVTDQGIGMTPEQVGRVFERFFRADPSGTIPGTGLGMSLVKEITERMGGRVEVVSQPGAGTTVTLWLPTREPSVVKALVPPAETGSSAGEFTLWLNDAVDGGVGHAPLELAA